LLFLGVLSMERKGDRVKIGAYISKDVADKLYDFIRRHYDRPYGKLSEVLEKALRIGLEVLEREVEGRGEQ